jgi:hypothetical protein
MSDVATNFLIFLTSLGALFGFITWWTGRNKGSKK